jgi:integrase
MEILESLRCPRCGSTSLYRDGIRYSGEGEVQRFLCRTCFYRFIPESSKRQRTHYNGREYADLERDLENSLGAVKLLKQKNREMTIGHLGATKESTAFMDFEEHLKAQGYSESTVKACRHYLNLFKRKGIDATKPEEIKGFIAKQNWNNHSKASAVVFYGLFAKAMHISWDPPKYRYEQKIPFIPLEEEIDALISGSGAKMSTFLRLLKETGARCGEALRLTWKDLDLEKSTVSINLPEKGSFPRMLPISPTLKAMLNSMPRKSERIFSGCMDSYQSNFRRQRNKLSIKLKNLRLKQISFHTFRHFYATMRYAKTLNILKVQHDLGHKNINNTQIYTHLIDFKSEEYEVQVAETVEEAKKLREAGFEHYDTIGDKHLYSRRK